MKLDQTIDQDLATLFSEYIIHPEAISSADTECLAILVDQFPFCQILHAFINRSTLDRNQNPDPNFSKAALYSSDREILYNLLNHPDELSSIKTEENLPIGGEMDPKMFPKLKAMIPGEDDIDQADFLMLEEELEEELKITSIENPDSLEEELLDNQEVSKYDDDTLPFSFLWWLNKTRREYSETYQPYSRDSSETLKIKDDIREGLSQQIVENIFYQQASLKNFPDQDVTAATLTFKRKEEAVLDRFIQQDPQIKPPNSENLSTENKARTSALDLNELVSETLAKIYTRQMLIDKAIDTYKKLSLRFPEKSAYFTELIRSLEKKQNK